MMMMMLLLLLVVVVVVVVVTNMPVNSDCPSPLGNQKGLQMTPPSAQCSFK